jgi:hypothetical protein
MKTNGKRATRAMLLTTLAAGALGLSVQACGGAGPDGEPSTTSEKTAQTGQDLSIIGIPLPEPVLTIGLNDASVRIDPIGFIGDLLPPPGIVLPDPFQPINTLIGAVEDGGTLGVEVPGITARVTLPGLPIPRLPDLFDGGIPLVTP